MRTALRVGGLALVIGAWLACGGDYGDNGRPGEHFNACYGNGTCNAGLSCVDGICIIPGEQTDAGASSGNPSDGGTSSSGSTGGAGSWIPYFAAVCALQKRCAPAFYAVNFDTDDACLTFYEGYRSPWTVFADFPGVPVWTQRQIDACVAGLNATACVDVLKTLPECTFSGTLDDGAPCNTDGQCKSNHCVTNSGSDACGKCVAAEARSTKKRGDSCTPSDLCELGSQCVGNATALKCDLPKALDQICTPSGNECVIGTICNSANRCGYPPYARTDEPCSDSVTCGSITHTCAGPADATKCKLTSKQGEACSPTGSDHPALPYCGVGLECGPQATCVPQATPVVCK